MSDRYSWEMHATFSILRSTKQFICLTVKYHTLFHTGLKPQLRYNAQAFWGCSFSSDVRKSNQD